MARAEDYRRYAAECIRIARATNNAQEKATLIKMAEKWRQLAEKADHERGPEETD